MAHWEEREPNYLRFNDVIMLENGMKLICPHCPAYFLESEQHYSQRRVSGTIEIGVQYERPAETLDIRRKLVEFISSGFYVYKVPLDLDLLHRYVKHQVPEMSRELFLVPAGPYKIVNMIMERRGQQVVLQTFDPSQEQFNLYFYQGFYHETNIRNVKRMKNPQEYFANKGKSSNLDT